MIEMWPGRGDVGNAASALLLDDLRTAHQNLVAAMAVLDNLTRGLESDRAQFANARWRISQASLARRTVWARIFRHLLPRVSTLGAADLASLQSADEEMRLHSSCHVATWTTARIEADWEGYCEASRAIRSRMAACMGAEEAMLYPILERDAGCS